MGNSVLIRMKNTLGVIGRRDVDRIVVWSLIVRVGSLWTVLVVDWWLVIVILV